MTDGERGRDGETGPLARKHASCCMGCEPEWAGAIRRGENTQPAPETIDPAAAAYLLQPRGVASVKIANE